MSAKYYIKPRTVHIKSQVPIALSVYKKHPEATTLLFYPGTMATPNMYQILLQELHYLGLNVVGIHPLAHGLSSKQKKDFVFDDILQNGLDAEAWIRENFSGPIVVCGHSQGGILTLAHSLDNPNISASFPLCPILPHRQDSIKITHFGFLAKHRDRVLKILHYISKLAPRMPIPFFAYLSPFKVIKNSYKTYAPTADGRTSYPLCFLYSLFSKNLTKLNTMDSIQCPLVFFASKTDALFPLADSLEVYAEINSKQKRLVLIPDGGHLVATSKYYARHMAAYISEACAGFGLPIYITKGDN